MRSGSSDAARAGRLREWAGVPALLLGIAAALCGWLLFTSLIGVVEDPWGWNVLDRAILTGFVAGAVAQTFAALVGATAGALGVLRALMSVIALIGLAAAAS